MIWVCGCTGVPVWHDRGCAAGETLEQAVRSAEQAVLSNQRKSYQARLADAVDVLNAQPAETTAQRDLAQAGYLYLVSRLRLRSPGG